MKINLNQQDRYVRGIYEKMLGNLITGAIIVAVIVIIQLCTMERFAGTPRQNTISMEADSIADQGKKARTLRGSPCCKKRGKE